MKPADPQIALTLSRVTKLLLHQKIIKDDESLTKAISAVAQNSFSPFPTSLPRTKKQSPLRSLQRIITHSDSNKKKLDFIRKKIEESKKEQIREKPKISPNSRKIANTIKLPVLERIQNDLTRRKEQLKANELARIRKENEEFYRNCSFSPFNNRKKITRTPEQVVRDLYSWKQKKDKVLSIKQEWFRQENLKEFTEKPKISKMSHGLCKKRASTPIVDRLTQTQPIHFDKSFLQYLSQIDDKKLSNTCRIFSKISLDTEKSVKSTQNLSEKKSYEDLIRALTDH